MAPSADRRRILDIAIGILAPMLLLLLDPAVFRSSAIVDGPAVLGSFKAGCYAATVLFVLACAARLLTSMFPEILAGVLGAGAVSACAIGLALLPTSLRGALYFGIGLLGLTPFAIAFVYGRLAWEWYRAARASSHTVRWPAVAAACAAPLVLSVGVHLGVELMYARAVDEILSEVDQPADMDRGIARLRSVSWLVDVDRLTRVYAAEENQERRERLSTAFTALTNDDIEARLSRLND